jgi:hypothetical protein
VDIKWNSKYETGRISLESSSEKIRQQGNQRGGGWYGHFSMSSSYDQNSRRKEERIELHYRASEFRVGERWRLVGGLKHPIAI